MHSIHSHPVPPHPTGPVVNPDEPLPDFTTTTDAYAHALYRDVVAVDEIESFLNGTAAYDVEKQRWSIRSTPTLAEGLLGSVFDILSSIVQRFVTPTDPEVEREIVYTHSIPVCDQKDDQGRRICPDLIVRAAGPSFAIPAPLDPSSPWNTPSSNFGFTNMATYFAVKNEEELGNPRETLADMAPYSRQILRQQSNRLHVRSLVITEKHARLVHFDRGGYQITPPLDIHRHPHTLVRLVAGLCSTNERLLGLDDTIQWEIIDGLKTTGTLMTTGSGGDPKTYAIVEELAVARDAIRGRATTCWRVKDPNTGEELIVKDSWRPDDRTPEYELLELVKGVPGVVQMISYESDRGQIRDLRCPSTHGRYQNRASTRVVLKSYGKSIVCFTSLLQLLYAIRDAIAGHQCLLGDGIRILHRDISYGNVLLGNDGAPDGDRGVLIDLDIGFKATEEEPTVTANHNLGTRTFQSLSVLETCTISKALPNHDHLDDLESFFYLLTYIFLCYRPDGTPQPRDEPGPTIVWEWGDERPHTAYVAKGTLFESTGSGVSSPGIIRAVWGDVCVDVFEKFRRWLVEVTDEKTKLQAAARRQFRRGYSIANPLESLHAHREEHYSRVLQILDEAIDAVEGSSPTPTSAPNDTPKPTTDPRQDAKPARTPTLGEDDALFPPPNALPVVPTFPPGIGTFPTPDHAVNVEMTAPPPTSIIVGAPPPPAQPAVAIQPRRSARLREPHLGKSSQPPALPIKSSRPAKAAPLALSEPTTQVRRSVRIQKRRLEEEDDHPEASAPKARRMKKKPRVTTRSR